MHTKSEHQLIDVEQNRDKYIGGSDLPYILGKATYKYGKSRIEFAKEKLGLLPRGKGNEYTYYGQVMEPKVRNYINKLLGYHFIEASIVDETRKYRANTDGVDKVCHTILEVKTFSKSLDISYYEPQCQFYMELYNCDVCLLVGYDRPEGFYTGISFDIESTDEYFDFTFDDERVHIYKIYRDYEKFKEMEIEINKFKYLLTCLKEEVILNGNGLRTS